MKALRKITVPNPALKRMDTPADGFTHKDGKDGAKEFVAKHPVEKVSDANGNDDKMFNASNISRAKYNRADESFVNKLLGRSDKIKSDKPKDDPKIRDRPKIEKKCANEGLIQAIKDKLSSKKDDGTLQNRMKRATAGSTPKTRKDWMGKTKTNESTIVNPETRLVNKPHYDSKHDAYDVFHNDQHLGSVNSYTSKIKGYHPNGKDGKPDPKFDPYHKWMSNPKQEDNQMFKKGRSGHSSKESAVSSLKDAHHIWEEVELQELSDKTIKNYLGKASLSKSMAEKSAKRASVDYDRSGRKSDLKKVDSSVDKVRRRNTGITKALVKVRKEDVEQLDELSRKTLGSYIKKATNDVSFHSFAAGDPKNKKSLTNDKKAFSRQKGVEKATDRLTKEDTLNELSKRLKTSYVSKAIDDVASNATKIPMASRDFKNSFKRRIANRKAGIQAAMKD